MPRICSPSCNIIPSLTNSFEFNCWNFPRYRRVLRHILYTARFVPKYCYYFAYNLITSVTFRFEFSCLKCPQYRKVPWPIWYTVPDISSCNLLLYSFDFALSREPYDIHLVLFSRNCLNASWNQITSLTYSFEFNYPNCLQCPVTDIIYS